MARLPIELDYVAAMKTSGMNENTELLAIHHTALATWAVQRLGKALLISTLAGFVIALWGVLVSESGLVALAPFVGFLTFALYLANSAAPLPPLIEDESND